MISYQQFSQIKYLGNERKLPAYKIAEIAGLTEPTVLKWLKAESFEPRKKAPRSSILDPFKGEIVARLAEFSGYSAQQIFQFITEKGYKGGYTLVKRFVREVRPKTPEAFLTPKFTAGECAQVDFGYCGYIEIDGVKKRLYCFVMVLGFSRMMYVEFVMRQNLEHFLQCHRNAFEYFGGVVDMIMVDNCKTAVISHSSDGVVVFNKDYADLSRHYQFKIHACAPRKPNQKGRVERGIRYVKQNFLQGYKPHTLSSTNTDCRNWLENIANVRIHGQTHQQPVELFKVEKERLRALPILPYECATIKQVRSSSQFRVSFEGNRYSVPSQYASTLLTLHVHTTRLYFYYKDKLIADHLRYYGTKKTIEDPDHEKELLKIRKKGRERQLLKKFMCLSDSSEIFYQGLQQRALNTRHHLRHITALAEIHPEAVVEKAIDRAVELSTFSSDYVRYLVNTFSSLPLVEEGQVHLTKSADALDIELTQTDLSVYDNYMTKLQGNQQ